MTTKIEPGAPIMTLVNTFTTTPVTQQAVLDILLDTTAAHICHLPGFVSANFHKSADGTNIVNYAQWQTAEAWQAMLADPIASGHIADVRKLATSNFNTYEVVASFSPTSAPEPVA